MNDFNKHSASHYLTLPLPLLPKGVGMQVSTHNSSRYSENHSNHLTCPYSVPHLHFRTSTHPVNFNLFFLNVQTIRPSRHISSQKGSWTEKNKTVLFKAFILAEREKEKLLLRVVDEKGCQKTVFWIFFYASFCVRSSIPFQTFSNFRLFLSVFSLIAPVSVERGVLYHITNACTRSNVDLSVQL